MRVDKSRGRTQFSPCRFLGCHLRRLDKRMKGISLRTSLFARPKNLLVPLPQLQVQGVSSATSSRCFAKATIHQTGQRGARTARSERGPAGASGTVHPALTRASLSPGRQFVRWASVMMDTTAPVGSCSTAKRPAVGISIGPASTRPPSFAVSATLASQSSTLM